MKRLPVYWNSIEPLYRAGTLSNRQICEQYAADHKNSQTFKNTVTDTAIRKKAKSLNWEKDLAEKVKKQVKENLVRSQVCTTNQGAKFSDKEIIDQAAEVGYAIAKRSRLC